MNDLILEWTLLDDNRIIIVEGINDKRLIQKVLREKVPIICTYGTFGIEKFDEMLEDYDLDNREVYIFVDADEPGIELRRELMKELPHAQHMYIPSEHVEVETTPENIIATELVKHNFDIHPIYLMF